MELGLSSYFEVSGFNNNESTTTYSWNFGDGTYLPADTLPFASHTYQNVGVYSVIVTINDGNSQSNCNIRHTVHDVVSGDKPANATTIILDASGNYVWNVNPDNNSITKSDIRSFGNTQEFNTGKNPVSLAQDGAGNIWVANRDEASVQVFDNSGKIIKTIPLPRGSMPAALVISPDKKFAYVSLHAMESVVKIDVANVTVVLTKKIGYFPKGLAVTRNSEWLYVTQFITQDEEGAVWVLDAATLDVLKTIVLAPDTTTTDSEFAGRGVPNYLNSVCLSPDERIALVPGKKDNIYRGLQTDGNELNFENTVRAILNFINLTSRQEDFQARIDINNGDMPVFSIFSKFGNLIFTAMQGNDRIDIFDAYRGAFLTTIENVGFAPQGMTLSVTGDTMLIHNFISRTISAYYIRNIVYQVSNDIPKVGEIKTVKKETMNAVVLRGKKVFYNANDERMNTDEYMSCATCHLDGDDDGRIWDLTQLGEGIRNTIPLFGRGGLKHGPVHWTGNFDEIQDFEGQIRDLAGGTGFMSNTDFHLGTRSHPMGDTKAGLSADLDALAAFIASLDKFGDSPYKNSDGTLTAAGQRGKMVFAKHKCGLCHSGSEFTDSEKRLLHDIGSIKEHSGTRLEKTLLGFDVPTLKGLWLSPPYMHDGTAKTLRDAIEYNSGVMAHSKNQISESDMDDLVAYLMQLDDNEKSDAPFIKLQLASPENFSLLKTHQVVPLKVETDLKEVSEIRYYINGDEVATSNNLNEAVSHTFTATGQYVLQAKVFHNGKFASVTPETKITVLEDVCDLGLTIMPNPINNLLRINTNGINASTVKLYDYLGREWLNATMLNSSEVFNFSGMASGVYLLVVEKDGCRTVRKVLKD